MITEATFLFVFKGFEYKARGKRITAFEGLCGKRVGKELAELFVSSEYFDIFFSEYLFDLVAAFQKFRGRFSEFFNVEYVWRSRGVKIIKL